MLRAYDDITRRLGVPLWWDDQGVPRYDGFTPQQCGIYDDYIAYCLIRCQACMQTFQVANAKRRITSSDLPMGTLLSWEYGDPPAHDSREGHGRCSGMTMNSILVQIIEFWEHGDRGWVRNWAHEVVVDV